MVAERYDVTELVAVRRASRPPTWLFVAGLVVGWVLDVVLVVVVVRIGVSGLVAVLTGVLGYLLLPVPFVTLAREVWLRRHRSRAVELDRRLGDEVSTFTAWVDARVGEPVGLPPGLATVWLLRPEPAGLGDVLRLPEAAARRAGGPALAARHVRTPERTTVRLLVLPDVDVLTDGPEPPGHG